MAARLLLSAATRWRAMPGRLVFAALAVLLGSSGMALSAPVSFSRDVMPILSDNCLHCHGPDARNRKAGLRLDARESAISERKGVTAIVPGKPEAGELIARILSTDPDETMPPPKSHKAPLSAEQVSILSQWIEEGARWGNKLSVPGNFDTYSQSFLVISPRGSGSEPTTTASSASGCTGFRRAGLGLRVLSGSSDTDSA